MKLIVGSDTNYSQWPFLIIILSFYEATNISLTQNESYQQSAEKDEIGINKVLIKWKIILSKGNNINTLVAWVHSP